MPYHREAAQSFIPVILRQALRSRARISFQDRDCFQGGWSRRKKNSFLRGSLAPARGRDAVAWVLAREARPLRTVPAIAARLQGLYFDGDPHRGDEPIQQSVEEDVLRGLDAPSSLSTFTTTLVRTSAAWPHSVSAGRS